MPSLLPWLLLLAPMLVADEIERVPCIVNGTATSEPEAVLAMTVEVDGVLYGPFCSAVLIGPTQVLTAAHCILSAQRDYGDYDIYVVSGADLLTGGLDSYARVTSSSMHADFDEVYYTDDIGVLELAAPGMANIDPLTLNEENVDATWLGKDLRFVGFGITTDGAEDQGVKRYADIPLAHFDDDILYGWDTEDGQNVCSGDSGGATLELVSGGGYELAGINAFVGVMKGEDPDTPCADGFVGSTRVDVHVDWILENTGIDLTEDSDPGGGTSPWMGKDDPGWCAAAPAGRGGWVAALLALLAAAFRRPRSAPPGPGSAG